ncbi:hypothetical protein ILUMI_00223 [Ignelater luminosus]|uniref:Uncharacterized protein n=1 Tax=Ignelater luminosus TaxID=2038154 RepID=A0A8K0DT20_IGNLU|nr:hypothetical protein ILUMI_00223 [Ignelater luminosus]
MIKHCFAFENNWPTYKAASVGHDYDSFQQAMQKAETSDQFATEDENTGQGQRKIKRNARYVSSSLSEENALSYESNTAPTLPRQSTKSSLVLNHIDTKQCSGSNTNSRVVKCSDENFITKSYKDQNINMKSIEAEHKKLQL